ncbi:haloacid dehalogenase [Pedobacter psychrophilus]|uniref:Haloacid dehalogenase n=1 Tax=Pedobacter psychrophilus TaxID=1826909 RepID=A0A179DAS8_9SPHI|nr:HAD family phosphatase [Pedobacter psychrophilus]OAQ38151.1 haloacid dehalogenase [Pedobacter psychrophilus]
MEKIDKNIKNIIFDYGNVIFTIDFKKTKKAFEDLGINNVETFFSHKGHNSLFDDFETGSISSEEFRAGIRKISGKNELTDKQIDDTWNSLLIGVPKGNHELLLKLKDKYRIFLLSNINEIHLKYINNYLKTEFGLDGNDGFFEKIYYSHLVGKRKPNKEIFEQVLQENNLKKEETLFIDDSPQHLKTATDMGINTYLMTYPDHIQKLFKDI